MKLAPVAATMLLAISSSCAFAAIPAPLALTGVACDGYGTSMTALAGYLGCSGAWSGNNLNQGSALNSQVLADWGLSLTAPVDISGGNGSSSGTLSFAAQTGLFVVALKAGNAFSLYEFDGRSVAGGISSIRFDTLGVGFVNAGGAHFGQGLSHADLYGATAVPEAATVSMMLAGLAAFGLLARRRRSAA